MCGPCQDEKSPTQDHSGELTPEPTKKKPQQPPISKMQCVVAKNDIGQIRTDAPEGTRFLVLRDNHSATMPEDRRTDWCFDGELKNCRKYRVINLAHVWLAVAIRDQVVVDRLES